MADPEQSAPNTRGDPMWEVLWMPRALRELERLEQKDRERVVSKLRSAAAAPERGFRRLAGSPLSKLRVGDLRVLVLIQQSLQRIEVHGVRRRSHAYDR